MHAHAIEGVFKVTSYFLPTSMRIHYNPNAPRVALAPRYFTRRRLKFEIFKSFTCLHSRLHPFHSSIVNRKEPAAKFETTQHISP